MAENIQQMWDSKANAYYSEQINHRTDMPQKVIASLKEHSLLPCKKLLDVGGGSGRYAIPLASFADSVTVTDISSNMLANASDYAVKSGIPHGKLDYVQLDWGAADLKAMNWHNQFDLVFASMSFAVKTQEGLGKMIEASKGFCCILQYIASTDNVEMEIASQTRSDLSTSPHHDRNFIDWLFHSLWMGGFNPWVEYFEEELEQNLTIQEAKLRYERRYGSVIQNQDVPLERILTAMAHGDEIKISGKTTLASVVWKVNRYDNTADDKIDGAV